MRIEPGQSPNCENQARFTPLSCMISHVLTFDGFRESLVNKGNSALMQFLHFFRCQGTTYATGPVDLRIRAAPYGPDSHNFPRGFLESDCSTILSHCFQVRGVGFPGNITVPKVMVKPMIKRLKTYKNVIILRFHSVNATSTSAGVSWRLRCMERLILVVSSRDSYRYGDLNLLPVYPG